jgi:hypothetical protein
MTKQLLFPYCVSACYTKRETVGNEHWNWKKIRIDYCKKIEWVRLVTAYCESWPTAVNWTLVNAWRLWTGFRLTIRYFCIQATWRVPSACSDFRILWKMFMGVRTGILRAIRRGVKRNVSEELHTRGCYWLRGRDLSAVHVQNSSLVTTASINFYSRFLFCTVANKCTIISQIITLLLHVSTLLSHPQGARS